MSVGQCISITNLDNASLISSLLRLSLHLFSDHLLISSSIIFSFLLQPSSHLFFDYYLSLSSHFFSNHLLNLFLTTCSSELCRSSISVAGDVVSPLVMYTTRGYHAPNSNSVIISVGIVRNYKNS